MKETDLGLEFQYGEFRMSFGGRNSNVENLKKRWPDFRFLRAKQVHGSVIHEVGKKSPDYTLQGDGLISCEPGLALCSITADCVPVLIVASGTPWFGAFHAGWRGVAARLIPMGIERLRSVGADPSRLRIWIGPHLLQSSFEVQADVRDLILKSRPPDLLAKSVSEWSEGPFDSNEPHVCYAGEETGKFHVSLLNVLLEQIAALDVPLENVELELRDTMTDPAFHSARRDKDASGRQVSWIGRIENPPLP